MDQREEKRKNIKQAFRLATLQCLQNFIPNNQIINVRCCFIDYLFASIASSLVIYGDHKF